MIHTIRRLPHLTALLAAAVIVLQFAAVQHSIEHGGTLPDIGCEFCVSGSHHAPAASDAVVAPAIVPAEPMGSAAAAPYVLVRNASAHRPRAPPVNS